MPGGVIDISIRDDYSVTMTGSVTKICEGILSAEVLTDFGFDTR
jgi:diaminopimelate epimerase